MWWHECNKLCKVEEINKIKSREEMMKNDEKWNKKVEKLEAERKKNKQRRDNLEMRKIEKWLGKN